jgi:PDZ domain
MSLLPTRVMVLFVALVVLLPSQPAAAAPTGIGVVLAHRPYGTLIEQPIPGSPAALAGVRPGDVLTAVDGAPVMGVEDAAARIPGEAGTTVSLALQRAGRPVQLEVVRGPGGDWTGSVGVTLGTRPDGLVLVRGLDEDQRDGAWSAGVRLNDVIVMIDHQGVASEAGAAVQLRGPLGSTLELRVLRGEWGLHSYTVTRSLPPPANPSTEEARFRWGQHSKRETELATLRTAEDKRDAAVADPIEVARQTWRYARASLAAAPPFADPYEVQSP